ADAEGLIEVEREGEAGGVEREMETVADGLRAGDAGVGVAADHAVLGIAGGVVGDERTGIAQYGGGDEGLGAVIRGGEGDTRGGVGGGGDGGGDAGGVAGAVDGEGDGGGLGAGDEGERFDADLSRNFEGDRSRDGGGLEAQRRGLSGLEDVDDDGDRR